MRALIDDEEMKLAKQDFQEELQYIIANGRE